MLDGIPIGNLSAGVLVGVAVLMVFLGMLVPRRILNDKTKEADKWYEAYTTEREARMKSDAQTTQLLEIAKTTNSIIVAAFGANESSRRSEGEAHVASTPTTK
jgi:hypothetical protein